jgi:hypothetical protein
MRKHVLLPSVLSGLLALLALAACASVPADRHRERDVGRGADLPRRAVAELPTTTVDAGSFSGYQVPAEVVVRDQVAWERLYRHHAPGDRVPRVDFSRETVLAVFLGTRSTGGHRVTVESVEVTEGGLVVRYVEHLPGPDPRTGPALTSPFHIVTVPRTDAPVRFDARVGASGRLTREPGVGGYLGN